MYLQEEFLGGFETVFLGLAFLGLILVLVHRGSLPGSFLQSPFKGSIVCPGTLRRFRNTPSQWNRPHLFGQTQLLYFFKYFVVELWTIFIIFCLNWRKLLDQPRTETPPWTSPSKRENEKFGIVIRIFVSYIFAWRVTSSPFLLFLSASYINRWGPG